MKTNFNELIPDGILFSIRQIDEMGLISSSLLRKLIFKRRIEVTKLASKNFISRTVLIAYLEENTILVELD